MSTYKKPTKHPVSEKWLVATWHDDYFGNHNYGVEFPYDATIYKPEQILETSDWDERNTIQGWADKDGIEVLDPDGFDRTDQFLFFNAITKAEYDKGIMLCTIQGKKKEGEKYIKETKRPDGSQDVHIEVKRLDLKDRTPEDTAAEEKIIDAMSKTKVGVLVICKLNNDNIYFTCSLPNVRKNAEMVISKYCNEHPEHACTSADFIVVESAVVTNKPKVTTL